MHKRVVVDGEIYQVEIEHKPIPFKNNAFVMTISQNNILLFSGHHHNSENLSFKDIVIGTIKERHEEWLLAKEKDKKVHEMEREFKQWDGVIQ